MKALRVMLWLSSAVAWGAMLLFTHLPARYASLLPPTGPKAEAAAHALAYAALATLLSGSIRVTFPQWPGLMWLVLPVLLAYAADDEQVQRLLGRSCRLEYLLADAAGTAAAVALTCGLSGMLRLRARRPRPVDAGAGEKKRRTPPGRSAVPPRVRLPDYLGPEVEAALAVACSADGPGVDEPLRAERARPPSGKAAPVRAVVRRRMLPSE